MTYVLIVVALYRFWLVARTHRLVVTRRLAGGTLLTGFGAFNLVEGLVDHHLLGIHHVNERVAPENWWAWDLGFLVWGAVMLAAGLQPIRIGSTQLRSADGVSAGGDQ